MAFCMNCGTKLPDGAKFCLECGTPLGQLGEASPAATAPPPIPHEEHNNSNERQQEYVGSIKKCPSCGAILKSLDVVCPDCGMEISGRAASQSLSELSDMLNEIDEPKSQGAVGTFLKDIKGVFTNEKAKKKVEIIKNYPIPNTIGEITEFAVMASSNIDVKLSKKSFWNSENGGIEKDISDAWVSKLKQAYEKAKFSFSSEPEFKKIEELYENKMIELKLLKK